MKGRTSETVFNKGKIYQSSLFITTTEYDGKETHIVEVQFARPSLNTVYGKPSWQIGIFMDETEAITVGRQHAFALTRLVKSAMRLPRKWTVSPTGKRIKVNS